MDREQENYSQEAMKSISIALQLKSQHDPSLVAPPLHLICLLDISVDGILKLNQSEGID